jgi:dihydroflavonol-4-reductase
LPWIGPPLSASTYQRLLPWLATPGTPPYLVHGHGNTDRGNTDRGHTDYGGMSRGRVCVSGVTGFVAAQLVKDLLARGYTVHGTARGLSDPSRVAHVTSLPGAAENLKLFEAELLTPGAFDDALAGCELAVHCASPYTMTVKDPQKDLVDPAVKGTMSFLRSCTKAGTVKKVVMTSSITAITDEGSPKKVFDESDWNEKSSLTRLPYYYSKAQAEKALWDYAEAQKQFKVITINPTMIIGPSLVKSINSSVSPFVGLITGKNALPGILDLEWNIVDVRDVSLAHIAALENDHASGRYLCSCDKPMHIRDIVAVIKSKNFPCRDVSLRVPLIE